ncbi:TPA: hypothetical protein U0579_001014 [Streptococcus suis]|nr:hypothetical protein [Streptococcus suis]HEM2749798.1 hypothetical protein [Streptococcus suis]
MMMVIGNLGFWLIHMWPIRPILNALYVFLEGLLFPLNMLPKVLYHIIGWNPFSLLAYRFTLALQMGLTQSEVLISIFVSVVWGLFFYMLYRISFHKVLAEDESVGG